MTLVVRPRRSSPDGKRIKLFAPRVPLAALRGKTVTLSVRMGEACATATSRLRRLPPPSRDCD